MEDMARNLRENVLIEYTRDTFATPVTAGEVFGTLTYYPEDDGEPAVYDLYASRSIARRENAPLTIAEIEEMTNADPNPFRRFPWKCFSCLAGLCLSSWRLLLFCAVRSKRSPGREKNTASPNPKPGISVEGGHIDSPCDCGCRTFKRCQAVFILDSQGNVVGNGDACQRSACNRYVDGIVTDVTEDCDVPAGKLKPVRKSLDSYPAVLKHMMALAQEIANEDHCPLSETLRLMLPAALRTGRARAKEVSMFRLTDQSSIDGAIKAQGRSGKRVAILRALEDGVPRSMADLSQWVNAPEKP